MQTRGYENTGVRDSVCRHGPDGSRKDSTPPWSKDPAYAFLMLYGQFMKKDDLDAATSAAAGARVRRAAMPGAINDISIIYISTFNAQNTTGETAMPA